MMCNNLNLDLVSINAYTQFGKILSIGSQDILSGNKIMMDRMTDNPNPVKKWGYNNNVHPDQPASSEDG